jgi:ribosomal protein S18 acetylase RimI-like enzyme
MPGTDPQADTGGPLIRRYRDSDRDWVYDVCIETAEAGQGARGRYSTDDLVPDIFVGPYLTLATRHAYVLDNGERAVGYIVGTANTDEFVSDYREHWMPRLHARYGPPPAVPVTAEDARLVAMFHPEHMLRPELAAHPAHLHVNLLAGYRGAGHGRALIQMFLRSVAADGAASCHLTVRNANTAARAFYERLGWQPIQVHDPGSGTYLVMSTEG